MFILQTDAKSIGPVDQKLFEFQLTRLWELLTMPGTEKDIAFTQLAVKGLTDSWLFAGNYILEPIPK
jgi:hypothetical protein